MKTGFMLLSTAAIVPLLTSCASYQKSADTDAWSIKPIMSVRNSIETPDAYYQLGRYYQGQSRYELAITAYQKALALDGKFAEARNGLGVIYSVQGKLAEAIEQFRMAVELAPAAAHIHNNLGYALYLGGAYAEAVQILEHAAQLDPANQATRTNLAQAKEKAGVAVQMMAQASQVQAVEKLAAESREAAPPPDEGGETQLAAVPLTEKPVEHTPTPVAVAASTPAQAEQQMEKATVQAAALPSVAPAQVTSQITAENAVAAPPTPPVIHQAELQPQANAAAVPRERNVVPVVESRVQLVQVAPNVYELLERVGTQNTLAPPDQPKVQAKDQGMVMPVVQAKPKIKPARMAQGRIHVKPVSQVATAAAPSGSAKQFRIEVSNGNGLNGMAKKVAHYLVDFGYANSRLTNQKPFQVQSSEVQYRTGYREEAQSLIASLPGKPSLIEVGSLRQDINIRVVLGKDWLRNVAYFDQSQQGKIRLARTGSDT